MLNETSQLPSGRSKGYELGRFLGKVYCAYLADLSRVTAAWPLLSAEERQQILDLCHRAIEKPKEQPPPYHN